MFGNKRIRFRDEIHEQKYFNIPYIILLILLHPVITKPIIQNISLQFEIGRLSKNIGNHEIYHPHQFPTNFIKKDPSVWFPHEPPRMLYDLKNNLINGNSNFLKRKYLNLVFLF